MSTYPAVKIDGCFVADNTYCDDGKVWIVTSLIARAKDLVPFDLPLAAIYSGSEVWTPVGSAYGIAHHVRRALDVNRVSDHSVPAGLHHGRLAPGAACPDRRQDHDQGGALRGDAAV
ncbi:hypothetical protein P9875_17720 [Janthinobacterium rivuli]|uniref:Uncharacterized protein n=1 Tax=Janthinobacterium rivuli TaxID=2751478 RepID=A0ABY8I0J1_9BURK|nr:hypothetical protein [Janthinobacterium rivuli]WFR77562.1 hypothetical protein P9875_17720 [Janthinobacterium rivuli]